MHFIRPFKVHQMCALNLNILIAHETKWLVASEVVQMDACHFCALQNITTHTFWELHPPHPLLYLYYTFHYIAIFKIHAILCVGFWHIRIFRIQNSNIRAYALVCICLKY